MKKAFFFGDSNTYGYDPAGFMGGRYPYEARWTTILQELLTQPSPAAGAGETAGKEDEGQGHPDTETQKIRTAEAWTIAADGLPGRALPVTRYEWEYLGAELRRQMPFDLFAVMLGTNDLLSTLRPDAARTARRMDDLVSFVGKVLEREPAGEMKGETGGAPESAEAENRVKLPQLMIIAPPRIVLTDQSYREPYVCGDRTYAQVYCEEGVKLAQYYRELAAYRGIRFADASEWALDFACDGVHLSEEGHARFAAQMVSVLRNIS